MSKVFLEGKVGTEPKFKSFDNGNTIAYFDLVLTQEDQEYKYIWHRILCSNI